MNIGEELRKDRDQLLVDNRRLTEKLSKGTTIILTDEEKDYIKKFGEQRKKTPLKPKALKLPGIIILIKLEEALK